MWMHLIIYAFVAFYQNVRLSNGMDGWVHPIVLQGYNRLFMY